MIRKRILNYGLATLIFIGSYTLPLITKAEVTTKSVKQQFFDTIVDYARKQGMKINKIDSKDIEIKEKVTKDGEPALGILNRITGKMELQDSKLEDIATVGIHELTHREMYAIEQETELWFEKIPYKLEQIGNVYIATVDTTKLRGSSRISNYIKQFVIKEESERNYAIYDLEGNKLTKLELTKIIGREDFTLRIRTAPYPLMGVQGEFQYEKENNLLYYMASDIMEFYNEIVARIYEQIFSGYYVGETVYPKEYQKERSILGKSLVYLTSTYHLTPEQEKIAKNAEEAYNRLNEEALLGIIEKTVQIGGKTFKEAMEDLQDEDFAKSISLASIILTKDDFKTILEVYDNKGKEEVKKLLRMQIKEFEETKRIGKLKESDIIKAYLKKFNLNDEEVKYVLRNTKHNNFGDIFNSQEKIKHIERIKQLNLERLVEGFKKQKKLITKGL